MQFVHAILTEMTCSRQTRLLGQDSFQKLRHAFKTKTKTVGSQDEGRGLRLEDIYTSGSKLILPNDFALTP